MSDARPVILDDGDVLRLADMGAAIEAVEKAFVARADGKFVAPPRQRVSFADRGSLIFTTGGMTGDPALAGFRVRNNFGPERASNEQLVAVWSIATGRLDGVVLSRRVGEIRTGAIGGVAVRHMARKDATVAAVIGAGAQAATQIAAAAAVRPLREIRVFSRTADRRAAFAQATTARTGVPAAAASSAEAAIADADIVILATTSRTPVIRADWLKEGAHVNMLGSRVKGSSEIGPDVAERAGLIATDSPEQIAAFAEPYFLGGTPAMERMVDLAGIVTGRLPGRTDPETISLFCSVGLAGTEVMVAAALIAAAKRNEGDR